MRKNIVLFVDDEMNILSAIRRAVMDEDFKALFANSGKEALKIVELEDVSVIVTDMRMPEMDGLTLLRILRETKPQIIRIVLSGYTALPQVLATVNQADIFRFITKPWQMEEDLLMVIRKAIEYYNMQREVDELRESIVKKNEAYKNVLNEMEKKIKQYKSDAEYIKNIFTWRNELFIKENILNENSLVVQEVSDKLIELLPFSDVEFGLDQLVVCVKQILAQHDLQEIKMDINRKFGIMVNYNYKMVQFVLGTLISRLVDANSRLTIMLDETESSLKLVVLIGDCSYKPKSLETLMLTLTKVLPPRGRLIKESKGNNFVVVIEISNK